MNNINFDISFNSINQPYTNLPQLSPIFDSNNFRTLFRQRILNLLNNEINHNNITNNFINNSLYQTKKKYKKIISAKGEALLKFTKFNDNFDEKICPIMQISFEKNEEIIQLPCGHIFNKEGILQWLKEEQSKCPVCRYELPYDEIEIKSKNFNDLSSNDLSSNDLSLNDVEHSPPELGGIFNDIINWSNERHNNSVEENLNTLFNINRNVNPYSFIQRSLHNRELYEEQELQRAIMASLDIDNDEPPTVD